MKKADYHKAEATRNLWDFISKNPALSSKFDSIQMAAIQKGKPQIPGYVWHHHQDIGRMQLIPVRTHVETGHVGGMETWF